MASLAAYNDKNAEVYTPKGASLLTPSDVLYAVQVDAVNGAPQQLPLPPPSDLAQLPSEWEIGLFGCFRAPAHCCMAFFFPFVNGAAAAKGIGFSATLAGLFFFVTYYGSAFASYQARNYDGTSGSDPNYYYGYYYNDEPTSTLNFYDAIFGSCALLYLIGVVMLRHSVRTFYDIPGLCISDVCASLWCSCCVMSQLSAHTERAKASRAANADTLPGYQAA